MRLRSGSARRLCDRLIGLIISAMSVLTSVSGVAFVDLVELSNLSFSESG